MRPRKPWRKRTGKASNQTYNIGIHCASFSAIHRSRSMQNPAAPAHRESANELELQVERGFGAEERQILFLWSNRLAMKTMPQGRLRPKARRTPFFLSVTFQISRGRRQLQFAAPFPCDQHERDGSMKSSMSKREAKNWRHREDLLRIENFRNRSGERRDCPPNRKAFHLRCGKHAGGSQCGRQGEIYECGNRNGRPDTVQSIKDRSPGKEARVFSFAFHSFA